MSEKRDAYVQKLKAKLDEWNAEIDLLAARADQADADAKIGYQKRLYEMRGKREELKKHIAAIQEASEGAWEDLKKGLENSWQILKGSFSKAKSEFERGYREGRDE